MIRGIEGGRIFKDDEDRENHKALFLRGLC